MTGYSLECPAVGGAAEPGALNIVFGVFYRAVAASALPDVLSGSVRAGRYSRIDQPTLYLSASPEGVAASMLKYRAGQTEPQMLAAIAVRDASVVDLRDIEFCRAAGIDPADAAADWETIAAAGGVPPSWRVRQRAVELGASGLIDPSRKAPGLWHLTLFRWNAPGAPFVELIGTIAAGE